MQKVSPSAHERQRGQRLHILNTMAYKWTSGKNEASGCVIFTNLRQRTEVGVFQQGTQSVVVSDATHDDSD